MIRFCSGLLVLVVLLVGFFVVGAFSQGMPQVPNLRVARNPAAPIGEITSGHSIELGRYDFKAMDSDVAVTEIPMRVEVQGNESAHMALQNVGVFSYGVRLGPYKQVDTDGGLILIFDTWPANPAKAVGNWVIVANNVETLIVKGDISPTFRGTISLSMEGVTAYLLSSGQPAFVSAMGGFPLVSEPLTVGPVPVVEVAVPVDAVLAQIDALRKALEREPDAQQAEMILDQLNELLVQLAQMQDVSSAVFWMAITLDGVNLMVNPDQAIECFELIIEVQLDGSGGFGTSSVLVSGWHLVSNVSPGREIHITAAGIPFIEEPKKLFRIYIDNYVGPVRIVFKMAQINGGPGEKGGVDLLAAGQVEDFEFIIRPQIGDVNGDGKIGSGDAYMVLRSIVGLEELTPEQWLRADVTNLGGVTAYDAALILQYSAGVITEFPRYEGKGAPPKHYQQPSVADMIPGLREAGIDEAVLELLTRADAKEQQRKESFQRTRLLTTWGHIKH